LDLFFYGIKPSIFCCTEEPGFTHLINKGYEPVYLHNHFHALFFQEGEKEAFLSSLTEEEQKRLFSASRVFYTHDLIGKALKYPPKAIHAFIHDHMNTTWGIDYHNIGFATREEDIIENIKWMEKEIPIPKNFQTGIYIMSSIMSNDRITLTKSEDGELFLIKKRCGA